MNKIIVIGLSLASVCFVLRGTGVGTPIDNSIRVKYEQFMDAAREGKTDAVKAFLAEGLDVNYQDEGNATALVYAAWKQHFETVKVLLDAGANPNPNILRGAVDETNEDPRIVKALVDAGANVNALSNYGDTALMYADSPETVKILLAAGANPNIVRPGGNTALTMSSTTNNPVEVAKALIKAGANINHQNEVGYTLLMTAAKFNKSDLVQFLLDAGANPSLKDEEGKTALDLAREKYFANEDYSQVITLLEDASKKAKE